MLLSRADRSRLVRLVRGLLRCRQIRFDGSGGVVIDGLGRAPTPKRAALAEGRVFAKVTAASRDGSNWRWKYSWEEVEKATAGYGGWSVISGGRSGTTNLYNRFEDMNGASGLLGNGVNTSDLTGTAMEPKPMPTGLVIEIEQEIVLETGELEWWCEYPTGIGGGCS